MNLGRTEEAMSLLESQMQASGSEMTGCGIGLGLTVGILFHGYAGYNA